MILLPDNTKRGKNILIAFYVLFILQVINIISSFMQYLLLLRFKNGNYNEHEANSNDLRQRIVELSNLAMFIVCIVLFILWFRRAYNNLNISDNVSTQYSEGWAAGAWFVPIINLGRPYYIMKEIWEKTQEATKGLLSYKNSNIVGWWWALWVIDNVFTNITNKIFNENSIDELLSSTVANLICHFIEIGALILIIIIINNVMQFEVNLQQSLINESETDGEDKLNFII